MKKFLQKKIILPVVAILIFVSTTAFKNDFFEIAKQIEIFTTMFKELNMNYVDETNPADLMDTAIKSMLDELDPYTQFYNEQDVESSRINNANDYTGIGAKVLTLKDKLVIVEPYKDYAADKAGLKAGDAIIKVDNVVVADFKDDAANLLQGSAGTELTLTYTRQGKTMTTTLSRESLEIHDVPHYSMINDDTGYVVLRKFGRKASTETINAINSLKAQGAKQLVLDLRGNPGGLLSEAVNLVNIFVPSGGGQWAVQGPIVIESALKLGVSIPKMIMALAYGDQITNMLQPFWALPLLGITKLKAREILPYTLLLMCIGIVVFITGLLLW